MARSCFVPAALLDTERGQWCALPESSVHYLTRVLRLPEGETIVIRDDRGRVAQGLLKRDAEQTWGLFITHTAELLERPAGREVCVAPALIKKQRFSTLLEKLTELGVDRIAFIEAERSVVQWTASKVASKLERCQAILEAAARQSGAHRPPELDGPETLKARATALSASGMLLVYAHPEAAAPFSDVLSGSQPIALFSGPEGGFTGKECDILDACGALAVSLGPRILRAETAPVAMLSAIRMLDTGLGS